MINCGARARFTKLAMVFAAMLSAMSISFGGDAGAGNTVWTTGGPGGGPVTQLVRDPSGTLFAATNGGVWRSPSGSTTWERSGNYADLFKVNEARALAVSTAGSPAVTTIYAVSDENILKSSDGGDTWTTGGFIQNLPDGTYFRTPRTIAASNTSPAVVYSGWGDGMLISTDDAENWYIKNTGLPSSKSVLKVVIKPGSTSTAFASVSYQGLYRTQNTGASWTEVSPASYASTHPDEIFIDSTDGTIYVIYDSTIYYSTDDGDTWTSKYLGYNIQSCGAITVDHTWTPKVVALGCDEGVLKFYQEPGGAYYGPVSTYSTNNGVAYDILFAGGKFYLATSAGIFTADNGTIFQGLTWTAMNTGLIADIVYAVSLDPDNPDVVVAGADFNEVYKSINGGASWATSRTGLVNTSYTAGSKHKRGTYDLARDPTNPQKIYAATLEDGLFYSADGGNSWTNAVESRTFTSVTVGPDGIAHAGSGGLMYRGSGTSFTSSEVKNPSGSYAWIYSIAVDPADPSTVYAGSSNYGLFRSINGGSSWTQMWNPGKHMTSIAVDNSTTPSTVYAATPDGPYKSTDRGTTWVSANPQMNLMTYGNTLAVHVSGDSSVIFFGNHVGIAYSTDNASSWKWTMDQPEASEILDIDVSPAGDRLYVGTNGGGVYQYENFVPSTADTTAPVTTLTTSPSAPNGASGWFTTAPTITLTPNESGTSEYQWDSTSGSWSTYTPPLTAPAGQHTLYYRSADSDGNVEDAKSQAFKVDLTSPTATSFTPPAYSVQQSKTNTIALKWVGADNAGGSGIQSYDIQAKNGSAGTWATYRSNLASTSSAFTGAKGTTHYLRVKAKDKAGRIGYSAVKAVMIPADERSATFSSGWTSVSSSSSPRYLGTTKYAKTNGKWASYAFKGTGVALVVVKGPGRGKAAVYVDGRYVKTIDTYAASTKYRQLYSIATLKSASHTIKVVAKGTSGRPKVEIDGIAVKK